jgi:hypothetical protein
MSCSSGPHFIGKSAGSSDTTAERAGTALYVSKGDPSASTPLRFSSYAEKYAYYRGKAHCVEGSAYPCNLNDTKTYTEPE